MMDELLIEELALRRLHEKMDDAFRAAMQKAINAGEETTPTGYRKSRALEFRRLSRLKTRTGACDRAPMACPVPGDPPVRRATGYGSVPVVRRRTAPCA
jgi:hypothetical protein